MARFSFVCHVVRQFRTTNDYFFHVIDQGPGRTDFDGVVSKNEVCCWYLFCWLCHDGPLCGVCACVLWRGVNWRNGFYGLSSSLRIFCFQSLRFVFIFLSFLCLRLSGSSTLLLLRPPYFLAWHVSVAQEVVGGGVFQDVDGSKPDPPLFLFLRGMECHFHECLVNVSVEKGLRSGFCFCFNGWWKHEEYENTTRRQANWCICGTEKWRQVVPRRKYW